MVLLLVGHLLNVHRAWASILDQRNPPRIDAVFLDISKAFDRMPHHHMLTKLTTMFNIRGSLWRWGKDFLVRPPTKGTRPWGKI